jgi:hypothetical protein
MLSHYAHLLVKRFCHWTRAFIRSPNAWIRTTTMKKRHRVASSQTDRSQVTTDKPSPAEYQDAHDVWRYSTIGPMAKP